MKRIKVIGIGSPFGQDQLGWQVVELLQNTLTEQVNHHQISFVQSDRPGLRLLELIQHIDTAILVDAIDHPENNGQVLQLDRAALLSREYTLSSHALGVSEALAVGEALGDLPAEVVLFGLCVDRSDPLPVPQAQLTQLCAQIRAYIANGSELIPSVV
jgi:hydrogenase maturation protease